MKKTLIAIPAMDSVPTQFAQSLSMLQKVEQTAISFNVGSLVYSSRNELVKRAIEMGADYIFWLDSDMVFDPDVLQKMHDTLEKENLDILTGVYFRRVQPFTPVLFEKLDMTENGCTWKEFDRIPEGLFEVAGCGFGCVLMKTEVFIDVFMKHQRFFDPIQGTGEDLSFCWRARDCGYKIVCDPSIPLGHVGHQVITRAFFDTFAKVRSGNNADTTKC